MKMVAVATLAATLNMAVAAGGATSPDPFGEARLAWNQPQQPFRIISNIYYVGPAGVSAYLIVTPQGNILTDGGLPESADQIEANIKTLGFDIKDVKILLNSHAHFDHAGGLAKLKHDSGAMLVVSSADKPVVEQGQIDFGPSEADPFPPVKVDRAIHDGDTVTLGGVSLTAMITPGHTRGCTNWIMPLTDQGIKHTVIFFCSITTGGNPLINNRAYPTIAADYKASFARLEKLAPEIDIFLAPHGDQMDLPTKLQALKTSGTTNPFIDKLGFGRLLAKMEKAFDEELTHQAATQPGLPTQSNLQLVTGNDDAKSDVSPGARSSGTLDKLFTNTLVVDSVPVASFGIDKAGLFTLVLASGEIWAQQATDTTRARWRRGGSQMIVTIRQGSLGTFNMEVQGETKTYEVRPVTPRD